MLLTILIGTRNRLTTLSSALDALRGQLDVDQRILVLDAGSTDGTLEYVSSLPEVTLVPQGRRMGQARGLNEALPDIQTEYTCWLSDDNVIRDGMLDVALRCLQSDKHIGMVALKVKDVTGPYVSREYMGGMWPTGILNCNQGVIRTELLKSIGGFDEDMLDYGMDSVLTTEVLTAGYQVVFTKRISIDHYRLNPGESWISNAERKSRLERARAIYRERYKTLMATAPWNRNHNHQLFRAIAFVYRTLARVGVDASRMFDTSLYDWRNVLAGRFISNLDPWRNSGREHHLAQRIPTRVLMKLRS